MFSKLLLALCVFLFIVFLFRLGGIKIEDPLLIGIFSSFTAAIFVVELKKNNLL